MKKKFIFLTILSFFSHTEIFCSANQIFQGFKNNKCIILGSLVTSFLIYKFNSLRKINKKCNKIIETSYIKDYFNLKNSLQNNEIIENSTEKAQAQYFVELVEYMYAVSQKK